MTGRRAHGRRLAAALAAGLLAAGCGGGDPTAADAERTFEDGFLAPPREAVVIEEAGGTIVPAYDSWLVLRSPEVPVARHEDHFREIDCAAPRAFFERVLGPGGLPAGNAGLRCRAFTEPRLRHGNGRWLVDDPAGGRYYFRVWKEPGPDAIR